MKTLARFGMAAIVGILLSTCSNPELLPDNETSLPLKSAQTTVTVPFKAEFVSYFTAVLDDPVCGAAPIYRIIVDGPGNATQLGKFTFHAEFCCNTETGEYGFGEGVTWLEAANGDKIFYHSVSPSSWIVEPEEGDPSYYLNKWHESQVITGGTGRFEGATGELEYNGYNSNEPGKENMSFHSTTGTITLMKGKR